MGDKGHLNPRVCANASPAPSPPDPRRTPGRGRPHAGAAPLSLQQDSGRGGVRRAAAAPLWQRLRGVQVRRGGEPRGERGCPAIPSQGSGEPIPWERRAPAEGRSNQGARSWHAFEAIATLCPQLRIGRGGSRQAPQPRSARLPLFAHLSHARLPPPAQPEPARSARARPPRPPLPVAHAQTFDSWLDDAISRHDHRCFNLVGGASSSVNYAGPTMPDAAEKVSAPLGGSSAACAPSVRRCLASALAAVCVRPRVGVWLRSYSSAFSCRVVLCLRACLRLRVRVRAPWLAGRVRAPWLAGRFRAAHVARLAPGPSGEPSGQPRLPARAATNARAPRPALRSPGAGALRGVWLRNDRRAPRQERHRAHLAAAQERDGRALVHLAGARLSCG